MTATNDNTPMTNVPAIEDAILPEQYRGRVTVIIEINDGDGMNINGVEFTLAQGVAWMKTMGGAQ